MVSTIEFDRLADTLEDIRAQVRALSTTPALAFSSIEAGAILEHDADGNVVGQIGEQWDGTHAAISLGGPTPPTPSSAGAVDAGAGSVNVYYDGTFVNAEGIPDITIPVPSDYARTEIHASQDPAFTAEHWSTLTDSYDSPRGGMKTIALTTGTWYIRLVTRTLSGKRSLPASAPTPVTVAAAISNQDLVDLGERFDQDMAALDAALVTLGDETSGLDDRLLLAETDLDAAFGQINTVSGVASAASSAAATAQQAADTAASTAAGAASAAAAAQSAATAAQGAADTAKSDAAAAAGIAGGKADVLIQSAAPAAEYRKATTLWIDTTNGGNKPKRWTSGTTWTAVTDKAATDAAATAAAAQTAAGNAQTAAGNAQTTANNAATAASTAQQRADAAHSLAGTAEGNAQTALTNAAGAASAAAAADQLARDAAGLAGTKGETIVQTSAPTGTRAVAQNLWIRLPDNIPHRWNPASALTNKWEPVTDKTATDAAAAAAAAQTAANNASKNLFSTSTPSGTAPFGSTWFQVNATGEVIGQWQQTAAGIASTWTSRPVRSEVIANLDLGKLTVGSSTMATAVVNKLAVETAAVMNLDVGRLVAATANITTGVADKFFANIFATRRLSAQQVYIGAGPNPIPDPAFLDDTTLAARKARSTGGAAAWTDVAATATSPKGVRRAGTTGGILFDLWPLPTATAADVPGMIQVEAGDTWKFQIDVETSITASCFFMIRQAFANGTFSTVQIVPSGSSGIGRRTLIGTYKIPAGVIAVTPIVNTSSTTAIFTVYGNAFMGLKTDATLVVEGIINGQTVLGARVATADTGARIELNGLNPANPRFLGVNSSGQTYMDFSATGAFLKAVLEVDAPMFGQRIVLGPMTIPTSSTTSFEAAGLAFYKAVEPTGEAPPMITSYDGNTLVLEGRRSLTALPGKLYVGNNLEIQAEGNFYLQGHMNITGDNIVNGETQGRYRSWYSTSSPAVVIQNYGTNSTLPGAWWSMSGGLAGSEAFIGIEGTGRFLVRGRDGYPLELRSNNSGQPIRLIAPVDYVGPPTSTFSANLGIASNPADRLYKLGSSGALKVNREAITDEHAWRILDLVPRKWYDRAQLEELLGPDAIDSTDRLHPKVNPALLAGLDIRMHPGLVAQEVHAAGLTEFVDYENGEPSAVDYDRMWPLIIPILRYILERVGYPSTAKVPIKPSPLRRPPVTRPGAKK